MLPIWLSRQKSGQKSLSKGDLLAGKGPDKRREFFYWTDDGDLAALRYDQYKVVFLEQRLTV